MKKQIKIIAAAILIFFGFTLFSPKVSAQEQAGFSVQAILPENQYNPNVSYFDLRVEPGQQQELLISIHNHEAEEITVKVSIHDASTNRNALIVYEGNEEPDPSLKQPVSELVTLADDEIAIPAHETVTIVAQLSIPEEHFPGIKLGGFHFEKVRKETEAKEGIQIENRFAYVIGLQLSQSDEEVEPELHLRSVEPTIVNYRTAVIATIQNSEPIMMRNLAFSAQVLKEGEQEPFKEASLTDGRMAPNSSIEFAIDWQNEPLEAGDYRLKMVVADGEQKWEWEEPFSIEAKEEALNEEAVELETQTAGFHSWFWFLIGFIVLLLLVIALLLRERLKYKK